MDEFEQYAADNVNHPLAKQSQADEFAQYSAQPVVRSDQDASMQLTMNASPSGINQNNQAESIPNIANVLGQMESSGNYGAIGKPVNGKKAIGKYQIMEQNIPEWSKEILGKSITAEEFAKSPELQDQIAHGKIAKYLSKGYSVQDIPALWLSGKPLKGNTREDKVSGTNVPEYVKKFNDLLYKGAASLEDHPSVKKFVNAITPSATAIGDAVASPAFGAMQGVAETGTSALNLALDALNAYKGTDYHAKAPNFRGATQPGMLNDILFGVGDIGGQMAGGGAAFKALGAVPKLGNEASMLANVVRGAGAGAITGEEGYGGRAGSALAGGLLSPLTKLSNSSIANRIVGSSEKEKSAASQGYGKAFENVPKDEIVIPEGEFDYKTIRRSIPSEERGAFDEYLKNPTPENAHKAQSILGAEERSIVAKNTEKGNSFGRTKRLNEIRSARDAIEKGLKSTMQNTQGAAERYASETKSFAENVVPYLQKDIEKYKAGEQSAKITVDNLIKKYKNVPNVAKSKLGKTHGKSLSAKRFLNALLNLNNAKYAGVAGLGALGVTEGKKTYDRYNEQ